MTMQHATYYKLRALLLISFAPINNNWMNVTRAYNVWITQCEFVAFLFSFFFLRFYRFCFLLLLLSFHMPFNTHCCCMTNKYKCFIIFLSLIHKWKDECVEVPASVWFSRFEWSNAKSTNKHTFVGTLVMMISPFNSLCLYIFIFVFFIIQFKKINNMEKKNAICCRFL